MMSALLQASLCLVPSARQLTDPCTQARNKATALPEQYAMHSNASPQLQRALKTLPSRSLIGEKAMFGHDSARSSG